jgi:hypothetical protein
VYVLDVLLFLVHFATLLSRQVNGDKRPINVYSPSPNQDGQLSDEPGSLQDRGHFTSTESLEDIIDKEMRRKGRAVVQEAQV